jgi:hypothetical protein
MNVRTLAGLVQVQRSTTGRMVERLVTAGFLDRRPHPASRRELVVELTRRGQEVVHAVTALRRKEIARVVQNMPERERYGLVSTLTAFTTAGSEPPARHGGLAIEGQSAFHAIADRGRCLPRLLLFTYPARARDHAESVRIKT